MTWDSKPYWNCHAGAWLLFVQLQSNLSLTKWSMPGALPWNWCCSHQGDNPQPELLDLPWHFVPIFHGDSQRQKQLDSKKKSQVLQVQRNQKLITQPCPDLLSTRATRNKDVKDESMMLNIGMMLPTCMRNAWALPRRWMWLFLSIQDFSKQCWKTLAIHVYAQWFGAYGLGFQALGFWGLGVLRWFRVSWFSKCQNNGPAEGFEHMTGLTSGGSCDSGQSQEFAVLCVR